MPLINSPWPNALPLHELPATPAQLARLLQYQRDTYAPIHVEQLGAGQLRLTLERLTQCTETGRRWAGRIELTLNVEGRVIGSTVRPAELVQMADAAEPPKRSRRTAKPKLEAAQFWPGQLVKIPAGNRAWVDAVLEDGRIAVEVEFLGKDIYPAHLLTPIDTEPPAPEPLASITYRAGQRIRFIGTEHDELAGTLGTIEQVGGDRLLVRSDDAGLVTVGPDAVELVEDVQPKRQGRRKRAS